LRRRVQPAFHSESDDQLQNTMPVLTAAAPIFRIGRRVAMTISSGIAGIDR
jgi:hypothetical protein